MKNKFLLVVMAFSLVFGALGFWGGIKYQQSKSPRFPVRNFAGNGYFPGQNQNNFRPVSGEIISVDDKSITVKLPDSSSKIVFLTDSTVISKSDSATKEDLKAGEKISAFGTVNQDGTVVASSIQLNPVFRTEPEQ